MSLQRSLIVIVALTLLVPALMVNTWQAITSYQHMHDDFAQNQRRTLDSLVFSLVDSVWDLNPQGALTILSGIMKDPRIVRISVTTPSGQHFAELQDLERDQGKTVTLSAPIFRNDEALAQVSLTMDQSRDFDQLVQSSTVDAFQVFLQLILSIVVLLLQLQRRFVEPLRILEQQAARLNRHQLDEAFVWTRQDELGHLGNSLESTRLALKDAFETLEARVSERTRDLESFSYSVSHDLRAPLRAIGGFSQILEEELGENLTPLTRDSLDRIHRGVSKMGQLIEDLLNLSMVTRVEMKLTKVNLLAMAKTLWNDLCEKDPGRTMGFKATGNFSVTGDRALLEIALRNLLDNAWKYTAKNSQAQVWFDEVVTADHRWFEVSDNGTGFPPERADEMFEPFHRLHSEKDFPGSGVGLAIVKRVVARHGGTIVAESPPAGGARFRFFLGMKD